MGADLQFIKRLTELRNSRTVIVGVGNVLKGDDGAGSRVCEQLIGKVSANVIDVGTVPENYIQPIVRCKPENLVIIDAMDFGASAGTIRAFRPEQVASFAFSTHALSPRLFVDTISRYVNVEVLFVGIQPAQVEFGRELSPQVSEAVGVLVNVISDVFPVVR